MNIVHFIYLLTCVLGLSFFFFEKHKIKAFLNSHISLANNLAYVGLFVAMLLPYVTIFFGIDYTDTGYHMMAIKQSHYDTYVLSFATILFLRPLMSLCSFTLIGARAIGIFLTQVSIIFSVKAYLIWIGRKRLDNKEVITCVLVSICLLFLTIWPAAYDGMTILFSSILFYCMITYSKFHNMLHLVCMGVISAFVIGCRLPNIVISGIIFICIVWVNKGNVRESIIDTVVYACVLIFVYCILVLVAYGNFLSYFDLVINAFSSYSNADSHTTPQIWLSFRTDFLHLFEYFVLLQLLLLSYKKWSFRHAYFFASIIYIIILFCLLLSNLECHDHSLRIAISTVCILLLTENIKQGYYLDSALCLCVMVVGIVGSDTGLSKLIFVAVLPFLVLKNQSIPHLKNIAIAALLAICIFLPIKWYSYTFEDKGVFALKSQVKIVPELKYIRTTRERAASIEASYVEIENYKKSGADVLCLGHSQYLFFWINGLDNPLPMSWNVNLDDSSLVERLNDKLVCSPMDNLVVVLPTYKYDKITKVEMLLKSYSIDYKMLYCY